MKILNCLKHWECLVEFGYDLHFETISTTMRERAARYREMWHEETG